MNSVVLRALTCWSLVGEWSLHYITLFNFCCRVPESKSFFRLNSTNPSRCASNSSYIPVCNCTGKNDSGIFIQCNQTLVALYELVHILQSGYSCPSGTKKKRSAALMDTFNLDSVNANINHTSDSLVPNLNLVWPTPSGITKQQATDQCNTVLHSSPAFQTCSEVFDPNSDHQHMRHRYPGLYTVCLILFICLEPKVCIINPYATFCI